MTRKGSAAGTDGSGAPAAASPVYYRPELDVLRFFAFLMVFAHHLPRIAALSFLWNALIAAGAGVCIFFLLSAFLITELLMRERAKTGSIHVRSFFVRRVLRIWPLYFFAVGLSLLCGLLHPDWRPPWASLPYLLLLAGNFWVAKAGWVLGLVGPLWSLSIEEQFYLAIPMLMKLGGRQALRVVSWACFPVAYGTLVWLGRHGVTASSGVWVNSLVQFQFFAAGTLLAIGLHGRRWRLAMPLRAALLVGSLLILTLSEKIFHVTGTSPEPPLHLVAGYLMILAGCLGIFLAVLNVPINFPRPLTYLGRISYGLYVYHGFVLGMATGLNETPTWGIAMRHPYVVDVGSLLVTVLLAMVSFPFFERPFLRLKESFAFIPSGAEGIAVRSGHAG